MDPHGVTPSRFDDLVERIRRDVAPQGVLPSAQVAIGLHGQVVAQVTLGEAAPDSRFQIFSVTKAIVAAATWMVMADGLVDPSDKVASILDGFGSNGKDVITVEHLLTHTAGLPRAPMGPDDWFDRDSRLERYRSWRLNWEPGTAMEYHPSSAHWVVADVLTEVTGTDYRDLVYERISLPMGLPRLRLGATERHPDDFTDVNDVTPVGEPPTPEEFEALGLPDIDMGEVTNDTVVLQNQPEVRALGVPGGGGISTAGDVAAFYQHLLHDPNGLFDPEILADGTGRIRCELPDPMIGVASNRSLGLIIAGEGPDERRMRGFGKMASPTAFGHHGVGGQVGWADPGTGVSFVFCTNGHDANLLREASRLNGITNRAAAICDPPRDGA